MIFFGEIWSPSQPSKIWNAKYVDFIFIRQKKEQRNQSSFCLKVRSPSDNGIAYFVKWNEKLISISMPSEKCVEKKKRPVSVTQAIIKKNFHFFRGNFYSIIFKFIRSWALKLHTHSLWHIDEASKVFHSKTNR